MGAQWLDFDDFLKPFGHPFPIKIRNHPNLVNCKKAPTKLVFPAKAFAFWHQKSNEIQVFQDAIHDPIFSDFIWISANKLDLWTPFEI